MANIYVRSSDGNNSDNGSTWALAKVDGAGAAAIDAVGDTIWFSHSHAETTAGSIAWAWAGTEASPTRVICGNDGAEPPTAVATSATVSTTGASTLTPISSGRAFVYGITFQAGSGASTGNIALSSTAGWQRYKNCNFILIGTSSTAIIGSSGLRTTRYLLENCGFSFAASGQKCNVAGFWVVSGGSILSGTTTPTVLFSFFENGTLHCEGFDMSQASSGMNLVATSLADISYRARFIDCRLPPSWSGSPQATTVPAGCEIELINCNAGSVNYAYWKQTAQGSVQHETTIVRTSGASDGTTSLSWKLTSNSVPLFHHQLLKSQDIRVWNTATGSPLTATVEIVNDGATLNDDEVWLEVLYLGSSSAPLATVITDAKADIVASAAAQDSSSATWTTTGLSSPVKQKLSATFTPQMVGNIVARVVLAKASATVYVDPVITIS